MNESEAENLIAREGFAILETSSNYLYICCLAGMATGKPVKFFTGLPLCELVKLRNAVNDPDFSGKGRRKGTAESGNPVICRNEDGPGFLPEHAGAGLHRTE